MRRLHFRIGSCWIVALVLAVMAWDIGITSSYASAVPSANSTAMPRLRGVQFAQASTLTGKWDIVWKGARDTYTGTLEITRKADANLYLGKVTLSPSNGGTVIQDARITTSSGELHIECSNPREPSGARRNYNPDRFFVTLSGNRMEGYSLDTAGQRGPKIVLTKAKE